MYPYYYFSRHYQIADKIKPLYLTHYVCYLTSIHNKTRVVQHIFLHSRTGTTAGTYCSLWSVIVQNLFVWGFFKFVWWLAGEQYFDHRDHYPEPTQYSNIDPNVPERLLRP
jgi:hypothetical protein